jgi:hypothetical protein
MNRKSTAKNFLDQILDLPQEVQTELVETLLDMRAQHLGIFQLDDDERAALAHSAEDICLGRFASPEEVEETFARYRPAS